MERPGRILLLLCLIGMLMACKSSYQLPSYPKTMEGFQWLLGTWQVNDQPIYESWVDTEDGQFYGTTYKVSGKDTVEIERIILSSDSTNVFYLATVPNQNNGLPIPFRMEKVTAKTVYFENRKHDFPQSIHYQLKHPGLIHVDLGSFEEGGERRRISLSRVR